jgi:hypothetical protein
MRATVQVSTSHGVEPDFAGKWHRKLNDSNDAPATQNLIQAPRCQRVDGNDRPLMRCRWRPEAPEFADVSLERAGGYEAVPPRRSSTKQTPTRSTAPSLHLERVLGESHLSLFHGSPGRHPTVKVSTERKESGGRESASLGRFPRSGFEGGRMRVDQRGPRTARWVGAGVHVHACYCGRRVFLLERDDRLTLP